MEAPGKQIRIDYADRRILGSVGVTDQHDLQWVTEALKSQGLFDGPAVLKAAQLWRLTPSLRAGQESSK